MLIENSRWEVGSEFHWMELPRTDLLPWPKPCIWFARGRDAVPAVARQQGWNGHRLWVPEFFCPVVAACWQRAGLVIQRYRDDPREPQPQWETLTCRPGDLVLAVNYFGIKEGEGWRGWHLNQPEIVLFEDHSHDPFSRWAQESKADFAFASVRKTFPAPDGGVLWSPRGRQLPATPVSKYWEGSSMKLTAMHLKWEYLSGRGSAQLKAAFRHFQVRGEQLLGKEPASGISPWSRSLVTAGYPKEWRRRREANVRAFLNLIAGLPDIEPLFTSWPAGQCPFNVALVFASEKQCAHCFERLRQARIYTPAHWLLEPESPSELRAFAERLRTIPVDQRYRIEDLQRVAGVLRQALWA